MIWLAVCLVVLGLALAVVLLVALDWPPPYRDDFDSHLDELEARRRLRPNTGNVDRREAPDA